MSKPLILWVDDEIDILLPHILFLKEKGFDVDTTNNGSDALDLINNNQYDLVFLDENMPGISGLEVLKEIKQHFPILPVIMITKSEEEDIMEEAIGGKITDYLIKPVNPNQILLAIKKTIDKSRLISEKTTSDYQSVFSKIAIEINDCITLDDWIEIHKKLIYWELEIEKLKDNTISEILKMQKTEANIAFAKFIKRDYFSWFDKNNTNKPLTSQNVLADKVFPLIDKGNKVFIVLIDNLRFDQWKILQPEIRKYFYVEDEAIMSSILPTATQYSRNAMFAGLMPSDIKKHYPHLWLDDNQEGGKNLNEEDLLKTHIKRLNKNYSTYYGKVLNNAFGKKINNNLKNILKNDLSVVVYNFVDILSHSRTEMQMIKELAEDEAAYRSLTLSWFNHSTLLDLFKELSNQDVKVIITTDHGTIKVNNPIKVVGDRDTTTNLRYKQGRNLSYKQKEVFEIINPEDGGLPKTNISSSYIFSTNNDFFTYPNNYNHYAKYYKNTFQHGGVSMEEMLIPVITLSPNK